MKHWQIWNRSIIISLMCCVQYNRIADEILKLDVFPERFRIMDSEPERLKGIRRMLVDNYSVFYVIRDDRVIVTDVLYSASDIGEN